MGLSAGRCQSPALQILIDREKEIDDHQSTAAFKISGEVESQGKPKYKLHARAVPKPLLV